MLQLRTFALILALSIASAFLGWRIETAIASVAIGTVDPIPPRHQLGHEIYLENCGTCRLALPPAIFPSETWRQLITDTDHYGQQLEPIIRPKLLLVWEYLKFFSRAHQKDEPVPYRIDQSRFFKALHLEVEFSTPIKMDSCLQCHPAAPEFNFRRLSG